MSPQSGTGAGRHRRNSYQHVPFLEAFNEKNGTKLVPIGNTYLAPLRLFSNKHKTLVRSPQRRIHCNSERSIQRRPRLLLLEKNGLLKLKEGVNPVKAVVSDIASNPKNLKIIELERPSSQELLKTAMPPSSTAATQYPRDWIRRRSRPGRQYQRM